MGNDKNSIWERNILRSSTSQAYVPTSDIGYAQQARGNGISRESAFPNRSLGTRGGTQIKKNLGTERVYIPLNPPSKGDLLCYTTRSQYPAPTRSRCPAPARSQHPVPARSQHRVPARSQVALGNAIAHKVVLCSPNVHASQGSYTRIKKTKSEVQLQQQTRSQVQLGSEINAIISPPLKGVPKAGDVVCPYRSFPNSILVITHILYL